MKTILMLIASVTLAGQMTFACKGGDEARLHDANGKDLALLNKTEKTLTLAEGISLAYIGNCKVDNPDQDLSVRVLKIAPYISKTENLCVGLTDGNTVDKFQLTYRQLTMIAKSKGCGATIVSLPPQ